MDFEQEAKAIIHDMCLALNYNGESIEAAKEGAKEQVAAALREAFDAGAHVALNLSEIPKGSIFDNTKGTPVVRVVLGDLPVTKDGVVLGHGLKRLWCFGESDCRFADGGSKLAWLNGNPKLIGECYSTPEAAQSAAEAARKGEA